MNAAAAAPALCGSALAVDPVSGSSDGNGVLEAGETVDLKPAWLNNSGAPRDLEGTVVGFDGPAGATYGVADGAASYGRVPEGETRTCTECYRIGVTADERPALHWDAAVTELIGDGSDGQRRWTVHVGGSFADVPRSSPYYRFVETLLHRGLTTGCGQGAFCPRAPVTREEMAFFLVTAIETLPFSPSACAEGTPRLFDDVPSTNPFCAWIEELARRGIASECGPRAFCPHNPVTREQMARLILRALDPGLDPPECTASVFADVPRMSPFCRWVEELARRGITGGCGDGRYCGAAAVTREQMAVFLTTAFGLRLYGP